MELLLQHDKQCAVRVQYSLRALLTCLTVDSNYINLWSM